MIRAIRFRDSAGIWQATKITARENSDTGTVLSLGSDTDQRFTLTITNEAAYTSVVVQGVDEGVEWVAVDLRADEDEHYAGLGERFDSVDQRGKQIDLRVINGAVRDLTYKPIPFFMSTAGYGVRILGGQRSIVRLATPDDPFTASIRVAGDTCELRFYSGENLKDVLGKYTADSGRPSLPPPWVFGPWKSRDWTKEDQLTVLEDVRMGRELGLPGTVKLIDANWEPDTHTFTFDPQKYPDVEGMIRELTELGYKLVIWVAPFMVRDLTPSSSYLEAAAKGYLIQDPSGDTYVHPLGNSPTFLGSCIDFTNPEALRWWQDNIRRLVKMGISGFKTDFGEQVPDDAVFADGRRGYEVRNIYPYLYNRATYEAMQAETDGVLLARSAWDGSQALSAIWAGDQTSDFGPASGLPSVITAGQTAGLSGFPYWASDIGGYFGVPTDEVFRRWTQFGAFSPIMQIHGMGKREPWAFEADTLQSYRDYARLRMELFPYLYSYAHEASMTGIPMMRALALEFPDDPNTWGDLPEHQFLLGRELMVAPVYYGYNNYRHTYFPQGEWYDFWSGDRIEGGMTKVVPAEAQTIPVFVRAGSIVPMLASSPDTFLPVQRDDIETATDDLRVRLFPGADAGFRLQDGTRFTWQDVLRHLHIQNGPQARKIRVEPAGLPEGSRAEVQAPRGDRHTVLGADGVSITVDLEPTAECVISWTSDTRKGDD